MPRLIDRTTGAVRWTPRPAQVGTGTQAITLQAVTQQGLTRQQFEVEVAYTPQVYRSGCACDGVDGIPLLGVVLFVLRRRQVPRLRSG